MYLFLLPLIFGFACNIASAFTAAYSRRWGVKRGALASALLRNVLGIPVWLAGFVLAARAPSPALFQESGATDAAGWLLVGMGAATILLALSTLGLRAVRPRQGDALATGGLYAHVRHPIHAGTLLEFLGLALVRPSLAVVIACVLGMAWVFVQTRAEEADLLQRLPGYRAYMQAVPRFFPRLKSRSHYNGPRK